MQYLFLLPWAFAVLAAGGPVSTTSCPTQCFTSANECNMSYGGCWEECPGAITQIPTFTRPLCAATTSADGTTGAPVMTITPAPTLEPTAIATPCSGRTICVDAMNFCGNQTVVYGGCYDACTPSLAPVAPSCTLSAGTDWRAHQAKTKPVTSKPPRGPCTRAKAWMCPPADW